jgi:site-specific DNA recombinase
MTLLSRVDIRPDCLEISVRRSRLVELLWSGSIELVTRQGTPDNEAKDILTLRVRARLQRVGREMKMLVENTDDQTGADPALLRIVARAHDIQERLMQKRGLTLHAIASQEHITPGYVSRLLRLSSLAPDIITAIVNGRNPPQLTAKKLMRLALEIPVDWTAQRKLLGFTHDKRAPSRPPHVRQACLRGFLSGSTILTKPES